MNYENDTSLVSVVDESVGSGPINIVVSGADFARLSSVLVVEQGRFMVGENSLGKEKGNPYDSALGISPNDREKVTENMLVLERALSEKAPAKSLVFLLKDSDGNGNRHHTPHPRPLPQGERGNVLTPALSFPAGSFGHSDQPLVPEATRRVTRRGGFEIALAERMCQGLEKLKNGELTAGAILFKGAGFGLTPAGDDFLAGFLLGLNVAEKLSGEDLKKDRSTIYGNALGKNPLSNAFLSCAFEGRVNEKFKALLGALTRTSALALTGRGKEGEGCLKECVLDILKVGETSGADTLTGFVVAVKRYSNFELRVPNAELTSR